MIYICPTCDTETPAAGACPTCGRRPSSDTVPIPLEVLRERFRHSNWPPPAEDEDTPLPDTEPQTPAAKRASDPGTGS